MTVRKYLDLLDREIQQHQAAVRRLQRTKKQIVLDAAPLVAADPVPTPRESKCRTTTAA